MSHGHVNVNLVTPRVEARASGAVVGTKISSPKIVARTDGVVVAVRAAQIRIDVRTGAGLGIQQVWEGGTQPPSQPYPQLWFTSALAETGDPDDYNVDFIPKV